MPLDSFIWEPSSEGFQHVSDPMREFSCWRSSGKPAQSIFCPFLFSFRVSQYRVICSHTKLHVLNIGRAEEEATKNWS